MRTDNCDIIKPLRDGEGEGKGDERGDAGAKASSSDFKGVEGTTTAGHFGAGVRRALGQEGEEGCSCLDRLRAPVLVSPPPLPAQGRRGGRESAEWMDALFGSTLHPSSLSLSLFTDVLILREEGYL